MLAVTITSSFHLLVADAWSRKKIALTPLTTDTSQDTVMRYAVCNLVCVFVVVMIVWF